jgi:eukaryotic-like serine/threonine-protein kinase
VRIGRYRTTGYLGEGATGVVHRATDGERDVAIKVLRAPSARFAREAKLAQRIDSRHVVPVLEVGDDFLVMPLYARTLADAIPLGFPETIRIAAQVARGLDALHEARILHRDVKPSNVLLDANGDAALADFGLARGDDSTQLTHDGQLMGTPHYLAPELIEGGPATPASDIYAFGCVLYECVTGAPPFAGRRDTEIGYAHLVEEPPDPRGRRPDLPADAALTLLTALAKEPRSRPTTATALARMLHLAGTPSPA